MTGRLLDRQARLLEYLTSGDAIVGARRAESPDSALQGIDRSLLDLEARFSHEKRMEKIAGVFPTTFALLRADLARLSHEFADACPPHDISRIANARQFLGFLMVRREPTTNWSPYVFDVAACEMACAEARAHAGAEATLEKDHPPPPSPAVRRIRGIVLLQCAFDVRSIFEGEHGAIPTERDTYLAVAWKSGEPRILELTPELFDVLGSLEQWVALEDMPGSDELVTDLAQSGLVELRR
jgi:hypothetical protein